jgi:N-acyl-D-amino-acid deacylase
VDGTGAPPRPGTVEIRDGLLRMTDDPDEDEAGRTIDATGKVVAPGFIDMHSHSGLTILAEPRHEPKVRQGITSEVIGVDGNSYAPFATQEDLDAFVHLNAGLDGDPRRTHRTKIDWDTVASYLTRFDEKVSVNIAYLVGNSALRIQAVGWEDVPATPAARARMQALLAEGMQEGAFGLSSGLDYPPGS